VPPILAFSRRAEACTSRDGGVGFPGNPTVTLPPSDTFRATVVCAISAAPLTKSQDAVTRMPYRCAVGLRAQTGAIVRHNPDRRPDERRPGKAWYKEQPAEETGSGQACSDEW
jgi:hypothetical protein